MFKEMIINADVDLEVGAQASVEVPGYVVDVKQADKRFSHRTGKLYLTLLYDPIRVNAPKKKLDLLVGVKFGFGQNIKVATAIIGGKEVSIWGILS